jgi:hypothetical protein
MSNACCHAKPYLPGYSICLNSEYYTCPHAVSFADMILCRHIEMTNGEDRREQDQ